MQFKSLNSYVYLFHLGDGGTFIALPTIPESVNDNMESTFMPTSPLSRSAPIYSYSHSGPRTVQINLKLHRDLMEEINRNYSNTPIENADDDYIDTMIKQLQAISVPKYVASSKMVNPPMVAVKLGEQIFVKGVVNGSVAVTYQLPLLKNDKYAVVNVSFTVSESDPYDAETISQDGSFRGLSKTLERNLYR